jgi:4-hydroxy-3-polyprenylbenzoate decarboxylase
MRDFLQRLEEMGEIKTLEGVDLNLEVGALTEFMGEREGPALLFGAFEGYPKGFRIV